MQVVCLDTNDQQIQEFLKMANTLGTFIANNPFFTAGICSRACDKGSMSCLERHANYGKCCDTATTPKIMDPSIEMDETRMALQQLDCMTRTLLDKYYGPEMAAMMIAERSVGVLPQDNMGGDDALVTTMMLSIDFVGVSFTATEGAVCFLFPRAAGPGISGGSLGCTMGDGYSNEVEIGYLR